MKEFYEHVCRDILGLVGCKYLKGPYPWDAGVYPETETIDRVTGRPSGSWDKAFFMPDGDRGFYIFEPRQGRGSRGPGHFYSIENWNFVGLVLEVMAKKEGKEVTPRTVLELMAPNLEIPA